MHKSNKRKVISSKVFMLIIFLALLRNLAEPVRIKFYATEPLHIEQVEPFMIGALECVIGLLIMTIFYFKEKHMMVIITGVLTIIALFIVKILYGV